MTTTSSASDHDARRSGSTTSSSLGKTGKIARLLKRTNADAFESSSTREQANAYLKQRYDDAGRVPGRRWRVEGGAAGNSRFLTKKAAETTLAKYGGELVELFTPPPRVTKEQQRREDAKTAPPCRTCEALQGEPCRHGSARHYQVRDMHKARVRDIAAAAAAAAADGSAGAPPAKPARKRKPRQAAAPAPAAEPAEPAPAGYVPLEASGGVWHENTPMAGYEPAQPDPDEAPF